MRQMRGNKIRELSEKELANILAEYPKIILDLGTGDGMWAYRKAQTESQSLVIGIDPAEKPLKRGARKAQRAKLENVLFLVESAENLPESLDGKVNELRVFLPWGKLLEIMVGKDKEALRALAKLLKEDGNMQTVLGYHIEAEPTEIKRLKLPELTETYIENVLVPAYRDAGLQVTKTEEMNKVQLAELGTSWGKKLAQGQQRPLIFIEAIKSKQVV